MKTELFSLCAIALFWIPGAYGQSHTAPPIVISSDANMGTIWARDRAGAPATNGSVSLQPVTSGSAAPAAVNSTGGNLQLGASAVTQPSSIVVQGNVPCPSVARSWTGADGVSVCNGTPPQTPNGGSASVIDSLAPATGSAVLACNAGTWAVTGTPSCQTSCAASVQSWVGSATCAASFPALLSGQSATLASTNGNTGSAQFTCNTGSWQLTGNGGCTAPSRGCYTAVGAVTALAPHTAARDHYSGPNGVYFSSSMTLSSQISSVPHGGAGYFFVRSVNGVGIGVQYTCSNGTLTKTAGSWYGTFGAWTYTGTESPPNGTVYTDNPSTRGALHSNRVIYLYAPRAFYSPL